MRILHCTDFHSNEVWFNWLVERSAGYSLVCLTGDCLDLLELHRIEDQVRLVRDAVQGAKCPVALCSGNNDSFTGEAAPAYLHHAAWLAATKRATVWGDGDLFTLGGTRFRSIGWNSIIPAADAREIWLYHAPPARSLPAMDQEDARDVGDEILGEACRDSRGPRVVFSGHQHNPRSWAEKVGRTWCFNPGVTSNAHVPNHIVIDLVANTATYRVNDLDRERVEIAP
jgi:predicted phosphodiesterase